MEDLNFIESHENEWKNKFIEINKDKETELKKANLFWEMLELCSHSVIADYYHKNNVQNYVWCDNWYYYNDMRSKIKTLGSFEDMLKDTPYNPITHGVLYIYKK